MLLSESEKARALRQLMLDIVIDLINRKTGGGTKYINQRDKDFLFSSLHEYSCAMKSHFRKIGNQMSGSGNHLCEFTRVMFYLDRIPLASICHVQHQCL